MTDVRNSPSGELEDTIGATVESVFGRTGAVVAEAGDFDTDQVVSADDAETPVTETLETIHSSDGTDNGSSVPGSTLTQALDNLLTRQGLGEGALMDTFMGGATVVSATSEAAAIGDLGWNVVTYNGAGAFSVQKTFPSASSIGVYILIGSTTSGQGTNVYLGSPTTGLFLFSDIEEVTFRTQMSYSGAFGSFVQLGVMDAAAQNLLSAQNGAGFLFNNDLLGPNYQAVVVRGGIATVEDTGVSPDSDFHNLRIAPIDGAITFYIDGVLRMTIPTEPLSGGALPFWGTVGGGGAASINMDNFVFSPSL